MEIMLNCCWCRRLKCVPGGQFGVSYSCNIYPTATATANILKRNWFQSDALVFCHVFLMINYKNDVVYQLTNSDRPTRRKEKQQRELDITQSIGNATMTSLLGWFDVRRTETRVKVTNQETMKIAERQNQNCKWWCSLFFFPSSADPFWIRRDDERKTETRAELYLHTKPSIAPLHWREKMIEWLAYL